MRFSDNHFSGELVAKLATSGRKEKQACFGPSWSEDETAAQFESCGILSLFHRLSVNTNQVAKRMNESGRIYEVDVQEILSGQKEIEGQLRQILEAFNKAL